MNYIEVKIEVTPFSEEFSDIIISAIEELPFESFVNDSPFLKAYIPQNNFDTRDLEDALTWLKGLESFSFKVSSKVIEYKNWNEVWMSNFSPIVVGDRCTVKAHFHKELPHTEFNIIIEPKMAFGTGHHQTTHLMIESILESNLVGKSVLDMGCGTGILSILAVMCGADTPVRAIDIDPIATDAARENSEKNGVGNKIEVLTGNSALIKAREYNIILANISRNIILSDLEVYSAALKSNGTLIISGFYTQDVPILVEAGKKEGLVLISEAARDNWSRLKFLKK